MTIPDKTAYPPNATKAAWDKGKSAGDKLLTKTGLGKKLGAAETAYKAIPWSDLVAANKTIITLEDAQEKIKDAREDFKKVNAAKVLVDAAYDEARIVATTKGLSAKSKAAATAAVSALKLVQTTLDKTSLKDFEDKIVALSKPAKYLSIKVDAGSKTVATAQSGEWNRSTKVLELSNVTWNINDLEIATLKGRKALVTGKSAGNNAAHNDADFRNDMQLVSGSKSSDTAKFKGLN